MWATVSSPVGTSNVPAAIEIRSPGVRSQSTLDPQVSQNPRRAVAEDRYQRSPSDSVRTRFFRCVAVNAAKCPLVRRHCVQWQSTTGRSDPRTSYRTAPQRHPPVPLIAGESSPRIIRPSPSKQGSSFFVCVPHNIASLRRERISRGHQRLSCLAGAWFVYRTAPWSPTPLRSRSSEKWQAA
jgi:hypothetical protein